MIGNSNFVKCVLSYPEADIALREFRALVQQKCMKVFDKHVEALASAFGYERELGDTDGNTYHDTTTQAIGARALNKDGTEFSSRIYWSKDPADGLEWSVGLDIYVWFKDLKLRAAVAEQIQAAALNPRFKHQSWEPGDNELPEIYLELTKSQIPEFDKHLDQLFKWSISAIRSRPKIKKLVRAAFKSPSGQRTVPRQLGPRA